MILPACLSTFSGYAEPTPKRFYDVIASRPARGVVIAAGMLGVWAEVRAHRCLLSLEGLEDRRRNGFLVCVLREFDEIPQ